MLQCRLPSLFDLAFLQCRDGAVCRVSINPDRAHQTLSSAKHAYPQHVRHNGAQCVLQETSHPVHPSRNVGEQQGCSSNMKDTEAGSTTDGTHTTVLRFHASGASCTDCQVPTDTSIVRTKIMKSYHDTDIAHATATPPLVDFCSSFKTAGGRPLNTHDPPPAKDLVQRHPQPRPSRDFVFEDTVSCENTQRDTTVHRRV